MTTYTEVEQIYYAPKEVAKMLGVHPNTVYNMINQGRLPAVTYEGYKGYHVHINDIDKMCKPTGATVWTRERRKYQKLNKPMPLEVAA